MLPQIFVFPEFAFHFLSPDDGNLLSFIFIVVCFRKFKETSVQFKVCHGKIGMSLHMKAFGPHVRELYGLRALEKESNKRLCLTD
jgi:hypothetical protein